MHAHRFSRNLVSGLFAFSALFALGCDDTATLSGPTEVRSALRVAVAVFGTMPDLDGYLVGLSTGGQSDPASQTVDAAGGAVFFRNLSPGTHSVRLESLAANCAVEGDNPLPSTVLAGKTTLVQLAVLCPASLETEVFKLVSQDSFAERFFIEVDGTFGLDFGDTSTSSAEFLGTYSREGTVLVFDFEGSSILGPWQATGTLAGDCMTVDYNDAMEIVDFEDGQFCLS